MSTILGDRLPREKNSISGLFSGIGYNPYIARHIADYAFGEKNKGAEESKSNRDAGSRRRKSKSKRKKSGSKRRKSIRKKSKSKRSKKSKRRKSSRK